MRTLSSDAAMADYAGNVGLAVVELAGYCWERLSYCIGVRYLTLQARRPTSPQRMLLGWESCHPGSRSPGGEAVRATDPLDFTAR